MGKNYIGRRNYGCRIKEFEINGYRHLSMENQLLKIGIALDKGADIYEFSYKPKDIEFMFSWGSFMDKDFVPGVSSRNGNFMDYYEGGWQELFPGISCGGEAYGAEIGMHGEAALLPWGVEILEDGEDKIVAELSVSTLRFPFLLKKTLTLLENSPILYVDEEITNTSPQRLNYQWGHHPALGGNFLQEGCQIHIKGNPRVRGTDSDLGGVSCIWPGQEGVWPLVAAKDGTEVDLSKVEGWESGKYREFSLSEMEAPSFVVMNPNLKLGFGMKWEQEMFPYAWVWQMYGGGFDYPFYGKAYTLAVEMWNSLPGGLSKSMGQGTAPCLKGFGQQRTSFQVFVAFPEGEDVSGRAGESENIGECGEKKREQSIKEIKKD